MRHSLLSRVRVRLFLLVLVALVPMLALVCHTASEQRRLAVVSAKRHALELLDFASMHQHQLMEGTRNLLSTLARLPEVRRGDYRACTALLRDLAGPSTPYLAFGIAGLEGNVVCSVPEVPGLTNISDRSYFRKALDEQDFIIGDYQTGGIAGRASLYFGYPVADDEGGITSVLYVALDLTYLEREVSDVSLPPGVVFTVMDDSGKVLASQPSGTAVRGQTASETALPPAVLSAEEAGTAIVPGPESYMLAFTRLGAHSGTGNLRASLSIPTRLLFEDVDRLYRRNLIGLASVTVLAVLAAWVGGELFFLRTLKVLVRTTERLASGDFEARTGLASTGEFGQLARAFDRMAEANAALFNEIRRSHAELQRAYEETLEGLVKALDLRDHETEGHSWRVTEMTVQVARELGMDGQDLVDTRRGALLHDIGKIGIPDSILLKPGSLDEEEWGIMRRHPVLAFQILHPISYLRNALVIPYFHHEKWDGTGYPCGAKEEEIPLAARAFAVVDVYDALLSERPYRPAWPEDQVLEHIRGQAGTHFDPQAVVAFMRVLGED
ncbi:MAG: HD domain-containing protein [Firmicutes bacterium]|nr:HD domain-containing protein [Bacillota bacterium]